MLHLGMVQPAALEHFLIDVSTGTGVLPAQACARYLDVPMIFAREKKPITMDTGAYEVRTFRNLLNM